MAAANKEPAGRTWKYHHIDNIGRITKDNVWLFKNYFFQEKVDGANVTIKFKLNEADKNVVKKTFYSRNFELTADSKFHDIMLIVENLRNFFDDVDAYVRGKLSPDDTLLLNCEFYGEEIMKRIKYGHVGEKRLSFFDCRLNGKYFSGLEFLAFQSEFLPNRDRYPYWPFVLSFNFGQHLDQFAQLYECKQLVDVPIDVLTSDTSYEDIFAVIQSIKPAQNKFEGFVLKSLVDRNVVYKRVFDAFRVGDRKAPVASASQDKVRKIKKPDPKNNLNEKETRIVEACNLDYMLNCLTKSPWQNVSTFYDDLIQDLVEDGFGMDDDVDPKKLKAVIIHKAMQAINIKDGSLK